MLQLAKHLGFELTDAFACHLELFSDLLEGMVAGQANAEAHAHDALFARRQCGEPASGRFREPRLRHGIKWIYGIPILDEIAETGIAVLADRRIQARRLLRHF